ncbi:MAG: hypothetical protein RLZZ367_2541 [Bacteroidota bacterium]
MQVIRFLATLIKMKAKFILVSFVLNTVFGLTAKADTIDFWHVYYNGVKIREYNGYAVDIISLKADSVGSNDSITVKYFRDTPCYDCATNVTVEDDKHHVITTDNGKGTFSPVSFLLKKVVDSGIKFFEVFYSEGEIKSRADKILLFRIKLE